jgi:outer membrane cobalamin receptor
MNHRALIACVLAAPALSAESPQSDEIDTVVVTGSRIRGAVMNTAPVTVVSQRTRARWQRFIGSRVAKMRSAGVGAQPK